MDDRIAQARRLDERAAMETGLAKAQLLAAQADRLRRTRGARSALSFVFPFLRN